MKKLVFLVVVLGVIGYLAYQRMGPGSEAYRTYQEHATAQVMGGNMAASMVSQRFGGPTTQIERVDYELESQQDLGEGEVQLVVLQHVQRTFREIAGPQRPTVQTTRHHVAMRRQGEGWSVVDVEKEPLN
jgi:hypothetical protein